MKANALIAGILATFVAGAFANDSFPASFVGGDFASDRFNGEAHYDKPASSASSVSRTRVQAELAQAQAAGKIAYGEGGPGVSHPASTKSRAEVLADLEIWRESGLASLELVGEGRNSYSDERYQAAEAKYQELRASPKFAARVQQLARQRGEVVNVVTGSVTTQHPASAAQ